MEIKERKVVRYLEVNHNRGFIQENPNTKDFSRLRMNGIPESYDFTNWTDSDLLDLAEACKTFVELKNKDVKDKSQTIKEWIVEKLYGEFPDLFVVKGGVIFDVTGIPLVKEDYEHIRAFMRQAYDNFIGVDKNKGSIKFHGLRKMEGDGSFEFRYIFNPQNIPDEALVNLPPVQ